MIRVSDWDFAPDKMSVFMMIRLLPYLTYCILRILHYLTFSEEWYHPLFSIYWPVNNHVHVTFTFLWECVSSLSFLSLSFDRKKICSSLTGPSRSSTRYALTRDVFSFQFLESSSSCSTLVSHRWLPHSSFVLTVFRAIRLQIRDIIEVNCLLIQILQVIQQVFSPEQKYLNTWPSSNRFQWISNQRRIAPHHRTRWSQWKAMIHKL